MVTASGTKAKGDDGVKGDLDGRVAIVTGSARNIGRAIALALASCGARVVLHGRSDSAELGETAKLLGESATTVTGETADPATAQHLVAAAQEKFGGLDMVVLNAAARSNIPFPKLPAEEFQRIVGGTLLGGFHLLHQAVPALIARAEAGQKGFGRIVALGGMHATKGAGGRSHVMAAKAGLASLMRGVALDLADWGITANVVAPGNIDTVRGQAAGARPPHEKIPLGRMGTPDDIANAVRFFCLPASGWITGQTLHVNGGEYLHL
jgi:3-oxoacyl-[acyl-carrier protein] reductase